VDTNAQQNQQSERIAPRRDRRIRKRRQRRQRRSRRALVYVLASVLGAGLLGGFADFVATSGASSPPPLGVYIGNDNANGVNQLGKSIGQQPSYAMDYLDGSSWSTMESSASNEAASWNPSGYSMTFSIPMLPNSGASLADGAAGDYNAYFETIAQNLVTNHEGSSILRPGWEFNGNWYTWAANSSTQSDFVAFWQQIVNTMRSVSGANFTFEWCPTLGDQGIGNLANYYPGNNYVDEIAADVYDQAWSNYPGAQQEFSNLETETYGLNWLTSFAASEGKAVAIGEWGLGTGSGNAGQAYSANNSQVSGGDDPTFINDMAQWLMTNHVYEASYFDSSPSQLSSSENPNSYNALIKDFGPGGMASGSSGASPTTSSSPAPTTTTTAPPAPATTTTSPPAPGGSTTPTTAPPAPGSGTTPTTTPPAPGGPPPGTLTTTKLTTSETAATVGDESTMTFTVTVKPAINETVGVYADGGLLKLCSVTLTTADGSGTCALSNNALAPGLYLAGAVTLSGPTYMGSFSNLVPFAIQMAG
jgi:Glycosyl hydrolase family 26